MTEKGKKRSAAIDFHIQGGNLEDLISEILKFRDKRDWAQFHDSKT